MKEKLNGGNTIQLRTPTREFAKVGGRRAPDKSPTEVAREKAQAAAAYESARRAQARVEKKRQAKKVRLRVIAMVMMTAALIKLGFMTTAEPDPMDAWRSLDTVGVSHTEGAQEDSGSGSVGMNPTNQALENLRDAFHAFPGDDQMDLVEEINKKHSGPSMACPLVWHDGVPALYVGDAKDQAQPYIMQALTQCASELKKLKAERAAAGHN